MNYKQKSNVGHDKLEIRKQVCLQIPELSEGNLRVWLMEKNTELQGRMDVNLICKLGSDWANIEEPEP